MKLNVLIVTAMICSFGWNSVDASQQHLKVSQEQWALSQIKLSFTPASRRESACFYDSSNMHLASPSSASSLISEGTQNASSELQESQLQLVQSFNLNEDRVCRMKLHWSPHGNYLAVVCGLDVTIVLTH